VRTRSQPRDLEIHVSNDVSTEPQLSWPGWVHPEGTVAIVTGAGSGIGQAACILAAQQGMKIAAWDINAEGAKRTVDLAGEFGSSIEPIVADVSDGDAVRAAMQETVDMLGTPTLLVNNAGPTALGNSLDFSQALDAAVGSVHKVTEAFLATGPGAGASVVNISAVAGSIAGGTGNDPAGFGWYPSAKAGILGYTRWCATEMATQCRFNAIAPGGPIETPRNTNFLDTPGMVERIQRNPMRRPGTSEELAAGILFLWSPAASYVNGVLLVIDGGLTLTGG
jgi:NAD(P)-dependent dehydrogenase (short-subunit alcohol dehydrogenase family)